MFQVIVLPAIALVVGIEGFTPASFSSTFLNPKLHLGNAAVTSSMGTKLAPQSVTGFGFGSSQSGAAKLAPQSAGGFGFGSSQSAPSFSRTNTDQEDSSINDGQNQSAEDVENQVAEDVTKELKKKIEKLESKTKQQEAMIKNLQDVQKKRSVVSKKHTDDKKIKNLMATVGQQISTISNLTESVHASEMECEKKMKSARDVTSALTTRFEKCEKELHASKKTFDMIDGCPSTFTNNKEAGICYGIVSKMTNYEQAKTACQKTYSGRLAVLNTKDKLKAVRDELTKGKIHQSVWVGAEQHDSHFEWVDGSRVASDGWAPGEPNSSRERCVDLHYKLKFKMNDETCDTYIAYVCEVPKIGRR